MVVLVLCLLVSNCHLMMTSSLLELAPLKATTYGMVVVMIIINKRNSEFTTCHVHDMIIVQISFEQNLSVRNIVSHQLLGDR